MYEGMRYGVTKSLTDTFTRSVLDASKQKQCPVIFAGYKFGRTENKQGSYQNFTKDYGPIFDDVDYVKHLDPKSVHTER